MRKRRTCRRREAAAGDTVDVSISGSVAVWIDSALMSETRWRRDDEDRSGTGDAGEVDQEGPSGIRQEREFGCPSFFSRDAHLFTRSPE